MAARGSADRFSKMFISIFITLLLCGTFVVDGGWSKNSAVIKISNAKDFKQFLRTHINVLVVSAKSEKEVIRIQETLDSAADAMRGQASIVFIDCSLDTKFCKKVKLAADTYEIKHFKDGKFHKVYDRNLASKSIISFLRDPTGDMPWEEDSTAADVVHIDSKNDFLKFLGKEKRPSLIMLYAPWCGYCKRLKPDFAAAATELKNKAVLVGIDADRPENAFTKQIFNITGYPTIVYFEDGKYKYKYGGESNREGIVKWMKNPGPPKEPEKEAEWSDTVSDVVHLTESTFDDFIATKKSVLVMFYAPWCGHCKHMKPEFEKAAATLKQDNIDGVLAAVDATKEPKLGSKFQVKGYPTVKYFKDGAESWGFNERTADKIIEFMKDPKEPPAPPPEEAPWEDTPSAVQHLTSENFKQLTKKKKHSLVMFYAPWCGHCKHAKPEYMNAAEKFKDDNKVQFGAIDCTKHGAICTSHGVSGYPTFKYFSYGQNEQKYSGGRVEKDFITFMSEQLNPGSTQTATTPGQDWADIAGYDTVLHLTSQNFDSTLKQHPSALVMFYAPWCGHCKSMKGDYVKAAVELKNDPSINGVLVAVDATVESAVASRYNVNGYPTLKYFKNGEEAFDYEGGRKADAFIAFMKNPVESIKPPAEPKWADVDKSVNHLTVETFNSFISSKPTVMVMFYAPWCGHCKSAKPAYGQTAQQLQQSDQMFVAAVDCVEHSAVCKEASVSSYPTIKIYKQGKFSTDYRGDRSTADLVQQLTNAHNSKRDEL